MSYSSAVKKDLIAQPLKRCCRRSLLFGILFARADLRNETVFIRLEDADVIDYTAHLLKEQFTQDSTVSTVKSGGNVREITFSSKSALREIKKFETNNEADMFTATCGECIHSFLRGIFLAAGRVDPPEKQYHLEFSPLPSRIDKLSAFLQSLGFLPKRCQRRGLSFLYFKDSTSIEDLLTAVGASSATLSLINLKIEREFINNANRGTNCYTANVKRTVGAAKRQIEAIERLKAENKLSFLPPDLVTTAEYRLEHQEMSLAQMAMSMTPPITKSGLNHRLTKIVEFAETLLEKK
ncbi:MAG: DNA-binding protein WhiA [Clostridia bacterium]|nr:DNA-binding protein WhiA [Clostridia bacterium]